MKRRKVDNLSRTAAIGMAVGRVGIGTAASFATKPALGAAGFDAGNSSARVLGRLAGVRDVALAGVIAASLGDRDRLREATLAATAADAADALIFIAALRDPQMRRAAQLSAPSAIAATVGGLWLASRLK